MKIKITIYDTSRAENVFQLKTYFFILPDYPKFFIHIIMK